jgi:hypothetical protein
MQFYFSYYILVAISLIGSSLGYGQSVTGNIPAYLEICEKAVVDPECFQNFRSLSKYNPILECEFANDFAEYLLKNASEKTINQIPILAKLEQIGNPITVDTPAFGKFSGTTLRYIVIADQIKKLFKLPRNSKIVEIGAGFGGQCYILSKIQPFSKYYIYDLPQVEKLIEKVMKNLSVKKVHLMGLDEQIPEEKIDLLISNYAFSECDRETQLDYFERVLKKADRGYILFNHTNYFDSLSLEELLQLLRSNNVKPEVYDEPVFTFPGNYLVVWDKTRSS